MLLIVGGEKDHNIACFARAARRDHIAHRLINPDANPSPRLSYQLGSEEIEINGESFSATEDSSLFIRDDVFGGVRRNAGFYHAIKGWALANPTVRMLNRSNHSFRINKIRNLILAHRSGLSVAKTRVVTDLDMLSDAERNGDWIAKPIDGGSYTQSLIGIATEQGRVWIVQERLEYPELRLFIIGDKAFAFKINANTLDSRQDHQLEMVEIPPPEHLLDPMLVVSSILGLDCVAADFKTNGIGSWVFLEINSMPMFTGYDGAANGKISGAMAKLLTRTSQPFNSVPKEVEM